MIQKHYAKQAGLLLMTAQSFSWAAVPPPDLPLGSLGITELQQATGNAVQAVCIGFKENGTNNQQQARLFNTCTTMVTTGNDIISGGGESPEIPEAPEDIEALESRASEPSEGSLGLNQAELSAALQQIATEEFANTEAVANEIATNRQDPVIARLAALRGSAQGFAVHGLYPEDPQVIADNYWLEPAAFAGDSTPGEPEYLRGGGAGDELLSSAWSGFLNIGFGTGNRDATTRTNAFDYNSINATLGADYRFTSNVVLGAALNYYQVDSDFDNEPTVSGGDLDSSSWGGTLYGTYYGESFYVDGLAGYAVSDYDLKRNILIQSNNPGVDAITETAKADTDSADYTLSIGAGGSFGRGGFGWGPYGRLTYTQVDIDDYKESGAESSGLNLTVEGQSWTSLISAIGMQMSHTYSQSFGVIAPQLRVGWIHQFENDAQDIVAFYTADPRQIALVARTDDPDRDYAELGLGVSAVFRHGFQAFFTYDTLLGLNDVTTNLFTLGGRMEF